MTLIDLNRLSVTDEDLMQADNIPGQPSSDPIALAMRRFLPVSHAIRVVVAPAAIVVKWGEKLETYAKLPQHAIDFLAAYDRGEWEHLEPFEMELEWRRYVPTAGPTVVRDDYRSLSTVRGTFPKEAQ